MTYFKLPRETAQDLLARAAVPEKARGETLSPAQLAALSDCVAAFRSNGVIRSG